MKNLFIFLLLLFLTSCIFNQNEYYVTKDMKEIAYDIIENPDKLRDLHKYFPNHFNNYLYSDIFREEKKINNLVDFLKNHFNKINSKMFIIGVIYQKKHYKNFKHLKSYNFDGYEVINCAFCKENDCFVIDFLFNDSCLYIFCAGKSIFDPNYESKEE